MRKRKFLVEEGYVKTAPTAPLREGNYQERIKNRILVEKQRAKEVRSRAKRGGGLGKEIDWGKLDERGDPAISFDPRSKLRPAMLKVFKRPPRDPDRRRIMAKVGTEFVRIYTRYRRAAERQRGIPSDYEVMDKEKPYAADAGVLCIVKGVTPRQALEYWHTNIRTFADRRMKVPPLSLLKSPGIIDQVACSALGGDDGPQRATSSASGAPPTRNSFSDVGALDVRLRPGLNRAGFDVQDYNDRFLLTIQRTAVSIAKGQRVFVSSAIKLMVQWAVENLYADKVGS
jgi:hypothetical protein